MFGFLLLALPMGIVASSFETSFRQRDFIVTWGMISRVPFFQNLQPDEIARISQDLRSEKYAPGALVIRKGDIGDRMFFIVSGAVEVLLPDRKVVLNAGNYFGEAALLNKEPRNSSVSAIAPTKLLSLSSSTLEHMISFRPVLGQELNENDTDQAI